MDLWEPLDLQVNRAILDQINLPPLQLPFLLPPPPLPPLLLPLLPPLLLNCRRETQHCHFH
jgi:hypothetical protein